MDDNYKICNRCVMDTTASDITFNEDGVCNYCTEFLEKSSYEFYQDTDLREHELRSLIKKIKDKGKKKKYDCIVGVSGGVDSSWTLYKAVELGLRPLAVHMDNGWNSELAQNNIQNLVQKLNVDLVTHVINWEEYKSLQQAFFNSDVIDIELLYDNALKGPIYKQAIKYKLNYILGGQNLSTEGLRMPPNWSWFKKDVRNIKSIYKYHGDGRPIKTFPFYSTLDSNYYRYIKKIRWIPFIDFFNYDKKKVVEELVRIISFKPYPYKHYESVFTRFYQGFILPRKFGVDKRRVHLSSLILTGQMNREEAISLLEELPYPNEDELNSDIEYFLKKMGWSKKQLDDYLKRTPKSHEDYPSEFKLDLLLKKLKRTILQ